VNENLEKITIFPVINGASVYVELYDQTSGTVKTFKYVFNDYEGLIKIISDQFNKKG